MTANHKICRLRCMLCKKELLRNYNVYDVPIENGVEREPVLYSTLTGYFYKKSSRHKSEVLEIPGNIAESNLRTCKLIAFGLTFKLTDLVDISGSIYRITEIDELYKDVYCLALEVYPYGISH